MGKKVHPYALRINWDGFRANWFSRKATIYAAKVKEDLDLRQYLEEILPKGSFSTVMIQRSGEKVTCVINAHKPGIIIGKGGVEILALKNKLLDKFGKSIEVNIKEIYHQELDANLVCGSIVQQIENRADYRKTILKAIRFSMRAGADGILVIAGGRLGGASIAKVYKKRAGRLPLHKFRNAVSYCSAQAHTKYGTCGIKVYISLGEKGGKNVSSKG